MITKRTPTGQEALQYTTLEIISVQLSWAWEMDTSRKFPPNYQINSSHRYLGFPHHCGLYIINCNSRKATTSHRVSLFLHSLTHEKKNNGCSRNKKNNEIDKSTKPQISK